MRVKVELTTMSDVTKFVNIVSELSGEIRLEDRNGKFKVNARSLLGVVYAMEWDDIWVYSNEDIYQSIKEFVR